jgi:hypothetical protein
MVMLELTRSEAEILSALLYDIYAEPTLGATIENIRVRLEGLLSSEGEQ